MEGEGPTLIKMKLNQKWKIPYALLEEWNLCFNFYKNREVKQKTLSNKRSTWKIKMWLFRSASEIFCSNMFYIFQHVIYWTFRKYCRVPNNRGVLNNREGGGSGGLEISPKKANVKRNEKSLDLIFFVSDSFL